MALKIIAHRWLDINYNNNLTAQKEKLLLDNIDGIEVDLRETGDGVFVLSHDSKIAGLKNKIKNLTSIEISEKIGKEKFQKTTLLTLLEIIRGVSSLRINLEIKDPQLNIEKLVSAIPHPLRKQIIISSFYPSVLRKISPTDITERWLLTSISYRRHPAHIFFALFPLLAAHFSKATGIAPFHKLVNQSLIKRASKRDLKIIPWTVNNIKEIKKMTKWSVWGIISDCPGMIK